MRRYEIMFILSSKLDDSKAKELQLKIEDKITASKKGQIVKKEEWGLKEFSYEIKKEKQGYYFVYYVEAETENLNELNRLYRITADLIRLMIIAIDDQWPYEMNQNVINKVPQRRSKKGYNNKRRPYPNKDRNENSDNSTKPEFKPTTETTVKEVKDGQ